MKLDGRPQDDSPKKFAKLKKGWLKDALGKEACEDTHPS